MNILIIEDEEPAALRLKKILNELEPDAQVLDIMDYVSNNVLMPIVSIGTCILIGWILKPKTVIDEVEKTGIKMGRKWLYTVMVKWIAPILLFLLLLKSLGILTII